MSTAVRQRESGDSTATGFSLSASNYYLNRVMEQTNPFSQPAVKAFDEVTLAATTTTGADYWNVLYGPPQPLFISSKCFLCSAPEGVCIMHNSTIFSTKYVLQTCSQPRPTLFHPRYSVRFSLVEIPVEVADVLREVVAQLEADYAGSASILYKSIWIDREAEFITDKFENVEGVWMAPCLQHSGGFDNPRSASTRGRLHTSTSLFFFLFLPKPRQQNRE